MQKTSFFIILLFTSLACFGQQPYFYNFEKLEATDTIPERQVNVLKLESQFNYSDYFFVKRNIEGSQQANVPCLVKKQGDVWVSYTLASDFGETEFTGRTSNADYFLLKSYYSHVAQGAGTVSENQTRTLIIVDVKQLACIRLESHSKDFFTQLGENGSELTDIDEVHSTFVLDGLLLIILNNCRDNDKIKECADPGGVYQFEAGGLRKIQAYNPATLAYTTIHYVTDIAPGMTLQQISESYPYAEIFKTDNLLGTCADAETGYGMRINGKVAGFLLARPFAETVQEEPEEAGLNLSALKAYRLVFFSPQFAIGGISTETTAAEILKRYPDANVRLDSLTEWEHMYIKELGAEAVFKTDESNRVAKYRNEQFTKLKNKQARPDFISVSQ
jgi:hypothetical protein